MYEIFEELLKKHGVTRYQVSKETGISQTSLSNWKVGRSTPKQEILSKIADYFGVTLDYLVGNRETKEEIFSREEIMFLKRIQNNDKLRMLLEEIEKLNQSDFELVLKLSKRLNQ